MRLIDFLLFLTEPEQLETPAAASLRGNLPESGGS